MAIVRSRQWKIVCRRVSEYPLARDDGPAMMTVISFDDVSRIAIITLGIWCYLFFLRGGFWWIWASHSDEVQTDDLENWPSVVAVVPARNEAETIGRSVASLVRHNYPGDFRVVVVDDHSDDDTARVAQRAAVENEAVNQVTILTAEALPAGWTGKLWALNEGVASAQKDAPEFYWFTDADVQHSPSTLRRLVARAQRNDLDIASLMVLLQVRTLPERLLIPPFLYFFLLLYPPRWIANTKKSTAGAAGGCILLRHSGPERIGGLAAIRGEVIDDCALARAVKRSGGRIWMGLTRTSVSVRSYGSFGEIRDMIARTAFTQLHYSVALLVAALAGIFLTYLTPPLLLISASRGTRVLAIMALLMMSISFLPAVRFYRLLPFCALLLPVAAMFYGYATWLSAARYWLGRGGQWKGRAQASRKS